MRRRSLAALACLTFAAAACARTAEAPAPGVSSGAVPDLRGMRVMLFPVQSLQEVGTEADAELAFALAARGADVDWVLPSEMSRASVTSPGLDVRLDGLPVGVFMQAEVRRVGDPLFGYLRRMGALVNSDVALIPVMARYRAAGEARVSGVEMAVALLAVRSGQVLWFGMVEGEPGAPGDAGALASAAEAVGRRLLPLPGRGRP